MYLRAVSGQYYYFCLISALSGNAVAGASGQISGRKMMDGGVLSLLSGNVVETSGGTYRVNLYDWDTSGNNLAWYFTASGCVPVMTTVVTIDATSGRLYPASGVSTLTYSGQLSGQPVTLLSGLSYTASGITAAVPIASVSGLNAVVPPATLSGVQPISGTFVSVPIASVSGLTSVIASGTVFLGSGSLTSGMIASGTIFIASGPFVNATANVVSGGVYLASGHFLFGSGQYFLGSGSLTSGMIPSGSIFIASGPNVALSVTDSPVLFTGTAVSGTVNNIQVPVALGTNSLVVGCLIKIVAGTGAGQARVIQSYTDSSKSVGVFRQWSPSPDTTSVFAITANDLPKVDGNTQLNAITGPVGSGQVYLASGHFLFGSGQLFLGSGSLTSGMIASGTIFIASGPFVNATASVASGSLYLASGSVFLNTFASGVVGGGSGNLPSSWGSSGSVSVGQNLDKSGGVATLISGQVWLAPDGIGSGQLSGQRIQSDVIAWRGSSPNILVGGRVDAAQVIRSNTIRSGTSTTVQLDASAVTGVSGVYDGQVISITAGTGLGRSRTIVSTDSSGQVTVYPPFDASGVPSATGTFLITPGGQSFVLSGTLSGQPVTPTSGQTYVASGPFVNATATVTSGSVYLASGHFLFGSGQYFLGSGSLTSGMIASGSVFIASGPFVVATASVASGSLYLASGSVFLNTFASGVVGGGSGNLPSSWGGSGAVTDGQNLDKTGYGVTSVGSGILSGQLVTLVSGLSYTASGITTTTPISSVSGLNAVVPPSALSGTTVSVPISSVSGLTASVVSGTVFLGSGSITSGMIASGSVFIASGPNVALGPVDSPVLFTGTALSGTTTTLQVPVALGTTSLVLGCTIKLLAGTGAGQARIIQSYNDATKSVGVFRSWNVTPDTTTVYAILATDSPRVDGNVKLDSITGAVGSGTTYLASGHFLFGSGQLFLGSGSLTSGMIASGSIFIASGPFVNATTTVTSGGVYLASGHFLFGSGQYFLGSGSLASGMIPSGSVFIASGPFVNATASVASGSLYLASGSIFLNTFASGVVGGGSGNLPSSWGGSGSVSVGQNLDKTGYGITSIGSGILSGQQVTLVSGQSFTASGIQPASGAFVNATATVTSGAVWLASGHFLLGSGQYFLGSGSLTSGMIASGSVFIASGPFVVATASVTSGSLYLASGSVFLNTFASGVVGGGSGNLPSSWGGSGAVSVGQNLDKTGYGITSIGSGILSGQPVTLISGLSYPASGVSVVTVGGVISGAVWLASGQATSLNSGQSVLVYSGQLSGQVLSLVSGQSYTASGITTVTPISSVSGLNAVVPPSTLSGVVANSGLTVSVPLTTISGVTVVNVSGTVFLASGQATQVASGASVALFSGQLVAVFSGTQVNTFSGQVFLGSGSLSSGMIASGSVFIASGPFVNATATVTSGSVFLASGQSVSLASGQSTLTYSGQLSGQGVNLLSGNSVSVWSGTQVNTFSGTLYLASGSLWSGSFASGFLSVQVPDALLKRDYSGVTNEALHSLLNATRKLTNKFSTTVTSGFLTVYKEDGTTVAYTQAIATQSGATPVTGLG